MVDLRYNDFVTRDLGNMIVLTGIPRSGTSILGQALGSLSTVEYSYEPPLINYLDAQCRHDELDAQMAAEIALPYLYFDHFAEYLHGRRYSFREDDFSYILDMKPLPEVLTQWSQIEGIQDAVSTADEHTFAFKYPGSYDFLDALYGEMPTIRVIDIERNLDRILASQYDKEWYFDHNLERNSSSRWPYHDIEGPLVPYLVDEIDRENWQSWNPETRTVYMVNRYAEGRLAFKNQYNQRETYLEEQYEQLVRSPHSVIEDIAEFADVEWGMKTEKVVADIRSTSAPADIDNILNECEADVREQFERLRSKQRVRTCDEK